MNRFLYNIRFCLILGAISFLMPSNAHAHVHKNMEKWYKAPKVKLSHDVLQNRLYNISSEVEMEITKEVRKRIKEYTVSYTASSQSILGRVMLYFPIFEKEIKKRNLPDELKYVAVVESLLKPEGTSRTGAAGLWQITKSTGRMLGLKINDEVDERRDPVKSTEAAMEYLEFLYNSFGDWTLAVAAYNCGPGNMRKAIRKGGAKEFSKIKDFLPQETQNYIPRFVAAAYLMNYYHLHNIIPNTPSEDLRFTTKMSSKKTIDFSVIEKQLNIKPGTLAKINPSLVQKRVPDAGTNSAFYIPESKKNDFLQYFQPTQYADMIASQNKIEEEQRIKKPVINPTDSLKQLGSIVNVFIDIIYPQESKTYNIPSSMRSNLSYLRA